MLMQCVRAWAWDTPWDGGGTASGQGGLLGQGLLPGEGILPRGLHEGGLTSGEVGTSEAHRTWRR